MRLLEAQAPCRVEAARRGAARARDAADAGHPQVALEAEHDHRAGRGERRLCVVLLEAAADRERPRARPDDDLRRRLDGDVGAHRGGRQRDRDGLGHPDRVVGVAGEAQRQLGRVAHRDGRPGLRGR
eukprot:scaffold23241_cov58-Phaeocystis_antarctica.AAC.1